MVFISTGNPLSFYDNTYVRTCLTSLNPICWPTYQLKLAQIIRYVVDITQQEVSPSMCCSLYIWLIKCSHVPSFDRYFILLQNFSFSIAVILYPQTLVFGGTLFGSCHLGGALPTLSQFFTNLWTSYGYIYIIPRWDILKVKIGLKSYYAVTLPQLTGHKLLGESQDRREYWTLARGHP